MVEYKKFFLEEMKVLLPYLVQFKENGIILPKKYPDNYAVKGSNYQLIIMIIHDKNIFSVNNSCQKVWTFKGHRIFCSKM